MIITTITQPESQLGSEISKLLDSEMPYTRIVIVSAFVALRTILRLREPLLCHVGNGTNLSFTLGIDLGGTSRDVLDELLRWNCETFIFHNTIARATFHPKAYLFETATTATLFVGSNNFTDGGLYTNYEATVRYEFEFPNDVGEYERLLAPLTPFFNPQGATVCLLDANLIQILVARGELPTEAEARLRRREQTQWQNQDRGDIPDSPFAPEYPPFPPLLPQNLRSEEPIILQRPDPTVEQPDATPHPTSILVWRKQLTRSDASIVSGSSHTKALVALTQAGFDNPTGQRIDQTTYFRNLFNDEHWEAEAGGHSNQEHAFVPMRIFIRNQDYGIRNFEISHKPSGEAGQGNSPTSLRWGPEFNPIIRQLNLFGAIFSLYETTEGKALFLIDITEK